MDGGLVIHETEPAMSVVKRGNSPYWYVQFQFNGQTFIRSTRTADKRAAERLEADWRAKVHSEQYLGQKQRISVDEAIKLFIDSKRGTPNFRNLESFRRSVIARLPGKKSIDELTTQDLERLKQQRQAEDVSPQTIKHCLNLVRGAWKHARSLGYRTADITFPTVKIGKYMVRYLNDAEEHRLLDALNPHRSGRGLKLLKERDEEMQRNLQDAHDLVVLLLDTGARYSEIANIEWSRIDLDRREIRLWRPKVQNEAVLCMSDRAFEVLARRSRVATSNWVFANRNGGPRGYASQSIRKAIRNAGLEGVRIHTLRHTHATRLVQNGLSIYEVREILGHSDIKTTMRYAHLENRHVTAKARDVINRLNAGTSGGNEESSR